MAMSILEIQKALKAAGFDPGPLDGIQGPKTLKALTDFQKARGLSMAADKWADTEAALGGGASGNADQATKDKYPQYAWLYNDPELGPILRLAASEGWSDTQLEGKVQQTTWWKTHAESARNYLQLAATDPAEATRRLNDYDSINRYIQLAAQYGQTVPFEAAARQVDRVVRGEIAPDALEQELRIQAKALYPFLGQIIDSGGNVADVFSKVQNAAAQYLDINPAEVRFDDPKWRSLLSIDDGKGGVRLRSDFEIAKTLRTDATYGFASTQNGRDAAYAGLSALDKGFGGIGGLS